MQLGMVVTKIHRILSFDQQSFIAPYIKMNSDLRSKATNEFEKDFLKGMNNSLFGKTMENLRKRVNVDLVTSEEKLTKLIAKPTFKRAKILDVGLVAVERRKVKLELNRPLYIGLAVLDLSKELMYDFYYNGLYSRYVSYNLVSKLETACALESFHILKT